MELSETETIFIDIKTDSEVVKTEDLIKDDKEIVNESSASGPIKKVESLLIKLDSFIESESADEKIGDDSECKHGTFFRYCDWCNYENEFNCDQCEFKTNGKDDFGIHIESCHKKVSYPCNMCSYGTNLKIKLDQHISQVHKTLKFITLNCNVCNYSAYNEENLKHHIQLTHIQMGNEENNFIKCKKCNFKTTTTIGLRRHVKVEHGNKKPYSCKKCDFKIKSLMKLKLHIRTAHKNHYSCPQCDYKYLKRREITSHIQAMHEGILTIKCDLCIKTFKSKPELKAHSLRHNNGTRPCTFAFCSSMFTTPSEVRRHVKYVHTNERAFKCNECDYAAVEKAKLIRHMTCHTGEKPYQCKECSMAFPSTTNLKRHIRTHTKEKPYQCEICSVQFSQLDSLKSHRQIHITDRPVFPCDVCPSTFGRKCDLNNHFQKLHTSDIPLPCEKCGKVFHDRYSLKLHTKEHTVFSCSLCTYSCKSLIRLRVHSNTHSYKALKCDLCEEVFDKKGSLKNHQILAHTKFKPMKRPTGPIKGPKVECNHCGKLFSSEGFLKKHLRKIEMQMARESFDEAFKSQFALMLKDKVIDEIQSGESQFAFMLKDKVIDEIQRGETKMIVEESNLVANSDDSTNQELLNSDYQDVQNSYLNFISKFNSSNMVSKKKKDHLKTCFGFDEYF